MAGRGRSSAAGRRTAAVLLLCAIVCALLVADAAATVLNVGGKAGWKYGPHYGHIAIKRGDALEFKYPRGSHDVLQVSGANFKSCQGYRPIRMYSSGKDSIKLTRPGTYYFICGFPGHCNAGMKLSVTVR